MTNPPASADPWPEAMAMVTACKYEFGAGRALAFGVPTTRHFRITFNYQANGELHTGELTSDKAMPQGTLFPIRYNPDAPHQTTHSATHPLTRPRLLAVGLAGSVLLSLLWMLILRGCR